MAQASSATLVGNLDAIQEASEFALFEQNLVYETLHAPLVRTDGISSRTVVKRLHRNALVRRLNYVVSAGRAAAALLANAGQVRLQESTPGLTQVVVDFGVPRTVASVGALDATGGPELKILSVSVWDGAKFLKTAHYSASWAQAYQNGTVVDIVTASDPSTAKMAIFPEVRTERLLLVLVGEADAVAVSNNVWVRLPDAPTDLELRLDGAVVWSAPGPAEPNARGFSADGTQVVEFAPVLASLTGDPVRDEAVDFEIVLTARVPGKLDLVEQTSTTSVSYVTRVDLGSEQQKRVVFEAEGEQAIALEVPSWLATVEEVNFLVTGRDTPERIVPNVGPAIAATLGGQTQLSGALELALDLDRSACVQLPRGEPLVELSGVRLPLHTDEAGAEVRVLLLEPIPSESGTESEPGSPIEGATSVPIVLEGKGALSEEWITFTLPSPVTIDPLGPPWVQIVVGRGRVFWPLGRFAQSSDANRVRRGPPTGPWRLLPQVVRSDATLGGRVRSVGFAAEHSPLAPLRVSFGGSSRATEPVSVTPQPKGARVTWKPASPITPRVVGSRRFIDLTITSYWKGDVVFRELDVVGSRLPGL